MEQRYFESLYPADVRSAEIEKILRFVKEGNSCQAIGIPGVGRANLLGFLTYNRHIRIKHLGAKQTQYHFVMVHFAEVRKRPLFDVMKLVFLSLVDSLRERGMEEEYRKANEIFKEILPFADELVLFQGLKRTIDFLAVEKDLRLVFLFDRFEEYIPSVTSEFFSNLRSIRNRAKYHFSVVFSVNRPLEDVLEPIIFADFYEFVAGHTVYLSLFDKSGVAFRISYLEKITGKKLPQETKDEILHLTGGHGKLTRLCTEACLSSWSEAIGSPGDSIGASRLQNDKMVDFLLSQKTVQGAFYEIWYSLAPSEQKGILSLDSYSSSEERSDESRSQSDSSRRASLARTIIATEDSYLQNIGLIADGKVTIPLFASFLSTIVASQAAGSEQIFYDEATNTIKKGD
ncbi:MAG: hypothetical protein HYT11_04240, partial [Candidatus Levybacteria bacterium]|nr:hypothetical protein [Candidatus Levybacteria bacterium]